jgi:hypothetical protein
MTITLVPAAATTNPTTKLTIIYRKREVTLQENRFCSIFFVEVSFIREDKNEE